MRVSPLASELALPSKVTVPSTTLWLAPALATGATLAAEAFTLTVATALSTLPSFTCKLNTYTPAMSAVKVGLADVAEDKAALELVGLFSKVHLYVMASPLASELALPSKVTLPNITLWLVPALATGTALTTDAVTVVATVVLSTRPSFTIKLITYEPTKSAVKVGLAEVGLVSAAVLPVGLDIMTQR